MAENPHNEVFEIRTNRLFYIANKQYLKHLGMTLAFLALSIVFFIFNADYGSYTIFLAVMGFLAVVFELLGNPKFIDVTRSYVKFQHRRALSSLFANHRISSDKQYHTTYTVYNIKQIDYLQTPLERLFNIGHICLIGDVSTNNSDELPAKDRIYYVYGIKNFDKNSKWMMKFIELSTEE